MKSMNKKYLVSSWIITALFIIGAIVLNMLASSLTTKFNLKLDLTRNSRYEISDTTREIMADLDKEVRVMVMGTEDEVAAEIKEYLLQYAAMSDNFKLEYVDVYKNQAVLNEYQAKGQSLETGDIILECGERFRIIDSSTLYNSTMSFEIGMSNYSFELESRLTNGIVVVTGLMNETAVYFLDGHGESALETLENSLNTLGFSNNRLNLLNGDIPEDAGLIVSVAPSADFTVEEIHKLEKFFDRGGNFFMVFTPGMPKLERVNEMLKSWGIEPNYDLVLEKDANKILQYESVMLTDTYGHDITSAIRMQSLPLVSYLTSSFNVLSSNVNNATVETILETTDLAVGKTNLESQISDFEEGDIKGPLPLAVVAEKSTPATSRLAVIGSVGTLSLTEQYEGNSELMAGLVSWLTNNSNTLKILPKIVSESSVQVTNAALKVMNYLLVWIIPVIILLAGIIIWIRRRYL